MTEGADGTTEPMAKPRKIRKADPHRARIARALTLIGYFGLIVLLVNWFIWISPPETLPRGLILILLVGPLLLPLRGLLHARRYTHQWVYFLAMFYFLMGVDVGFNHRSGEAWLGWTTVVFSLMLFVGSVMYARYTPSPPKIPDI